MKFEECKAEVNQIFCCLLFLKRWLIVTKIKFNISIRYREGTEQEREKHVKTYKKRVIN